MRGAYAGVAAGWGAVVVGGEGSCSVRISVMCLSNSNLNSATLESIAVITAPCSPVHAASIPCSTQRG